ncbi:PLP-dependent transferase [Aulographum hederae CBS 113979]|uniref:PLP-dependent transferase n=1 Tax=Aulographum hederae CBS 113979 TaxID=1176131 RepID=A0A6G1GKZ5_9PEZI|nr:PLP-dependent transferase [Aulographum hederae CBS 113979]
MPHNMSSPQNGAASELPPPKDLSHHISRTTRSREASNIKKFYKYFAIPGIGQLAGGLPNASYFPYDTLEARVALPDRWKPTAIRPIDPPISQLAKTSLLSSGPQEGHIVVPKESSTSNILRKIDLTTALQYGQAQGYPALYSFIREFTREYLHPTIPYKGGAEVILTCGSTDGFSKALQCLNNEWIEGRDFIHEREGLLVEEYCYMNAIQAARPRGLNIVPVGIDDEGMRASGKGGLEDVLANWDFSKGKRPHLMYTVTIGQNPTSGTLSIERRKEIYTLACKYDIIIVEDDPYWYLQFPPADTSADDSSSIDDFADADETPSNSTFIDCSSEPSPEDPPSTTPNTNTRKPNFPFLDSLVPSYLSIDTEGRILRLDTFSKTVAPGCRLGWITAQPALIERILRITETSTQQPSGFVQAVVAELIMGPHQAKSAKSACSLGGEGGVGNSSDPGRGGAKDGSGWDMSGWIRWLEGLRGEYERRMSLMCEILFAGRDLVCSSSSSKDHTAENDWAVVSKTRVYDFKRPLGGMFLWVRFAFESHPLFRGNGEKEGFTGPELARALWVLWTRPAFRVLVSPGLIFAPTKEIADRDAWECFRLCFAAVETKEVAGISESFVKGVKAFWGIEDEGYMRELLEDADGEGVEGVEGSGEGGDVGVLTGWGC